VLAGEPHLTYEQRRPRGRPAPLSKDVLTGLLADSAIRRGEREGSKWTSTRRPRRPGFR
jgi:hypothetical protein